ncbi:MAG: alpha-N-arabinofuranosidase [Phycisphaerales bacterium]|nr:MAG: alpha-N-arabinofuranosidase [Phycisphaerales bacterium]
MTNRVSIDPLRVIAPIDPKVFGGFAEHLGRCVYGGIFEPGSPLADVDGIRTDVLAALKRLRMPVLRYPGGNFVSGYRWRDGVGPQDERKARMELAWHDLEPNTFGTNEFVGFCRTLGAAPYLAVNAGDGDMREARDWVEYCNGTKDTALVKLRKRHGYEAPHAVRYWGIGNEVDGPWQIGFKTPEEYARTYTEFAKVMKWTDPSIELVAAGVSLWDRSWVERVQLLMEHAPTLIDYMAIHWYVGNSRERGYRDDDFASYMAISERLDDMLSGTRGILRAMRSALKLGRDIPIAVDEWNVWYRVFNEGKLEETYNLEDALVVAMHFNAFFRHAASVKMANIAQIVNVIAPIKTSPEGVVLQTTFHPFELYASTAGDTALDVFWDGATFSTPEFDALRVLDVSATIDQGRKQLAVYLVNRSLDQVQSTTIELQRGRFADGGDLHVINGPNVKAQNTTQAPDQVGVRSSRVDGGGNSLTLQLEPHSVTALVIGVA